MPGSCPKKAQSLLRASSLFALRSVPLALALLSFTLLFSHGNAEDLGLIIRCRPASMHCIRLREKESNGSNGVTPMPPPLTAPHWRYFRELSHILHVNVFSYENPSCKTEVGPCES